MTTTTLTPLQVPQSLAATGLALPDSHRDRGIHWVAGSGSGKSLSLGYLAYFDFLRGVPQVLFDPAGPMIDAFLLRVACLPAEVRRCLWPRIRYVDMSSRSGQIVAWPLLFEFPGENRQDVAARFLETCRAIDPQLQGASIQGFNALFRIGGPTGIILASLGQQLDKALDLLNNPEQWRDRLDEAERRHPDAHEAAEFFRNEYLPRSRGERAALTGSYRAKLEPILLDPRTKAMLCTDPPSVDFEEVMGRRQTVLLDFRAETNPWKRLLKTRWAYDTILAYIRHRGPGKHRPLALHFDEITELTNQASLDQNLFAGDLDYLFNVLQRNYSVWITAAHQQMWQMAPPTQKTLLSLDTQIIGVVSDMETAEVLAREYGPLDPHRIKRVENVWASSTYDDGFGGHATSHFVIDERLVDFPLDEQGYLVARGLKALQPFEFLVKPRYEQRLRRISLRPFLEGIWPNEHADVLAYIRRQLALRTGIGASEALGRVLPTTDLARSDILEGAHHDGTNNHISRPDFADVFGEEIDGAAG